MSKAYWISIYREIHDPTKLASYVELGVPAIEAFGGRFLARGKATVAYEEGLAERTTLIEFDSVEQAVAAYESPAYQRALEKLGNAVRREIRIIPAV